MAKLQGKDTVVERVFKTGETEEPQSDNFSDPRSRFDGTKQGAETYRKQTPGQTKARVVMRVVKEIRHG